MEVMRVEQRNTLLINPGFFGKSLAFVAVPVSARVVRNFIISTMITYIHMSTQSGGSTVHNGVRRFSLNRTQRMIFRVPAEMSGKDVLHFNMHCLKNDPPG